MLRDTSPWVSPMPDPLALDELILNAPRWISQSWYARLLGLLVDYPLALPQRVDLLSQPHNQLRHQSLRAVNLHAWRVSSCPSRRGFSEKAAQQISRGRRQSSRAVYHSKWRIFLNWCGERDLDPLKVSVSQLAEIEHQNYQGLSVSHRCDSVGTWL